MSQRSVPATTFHGESRSVDVGHVFKWLGRGWSLFMAKPVRWLLLTLALIVIMHVMLFIPYYGGWLISNVLLPVFVAGMLRAGQRTADEDALKFSDLLAGFSQKTDSLIILGALYGLVQLLVFLLVFAISGGSVLMPLLFRGTLGGMTDSASMFFLVPLYMAMWFAPALVFFEDAPPLTAIKASFFACCKNIVPFLVYGVLIFLLWTLAGLPFKLFSVVRLSYLTIWLFAFIPYIFLPVLFGSMLASYRDVFAGE